MTKIGKSWMAVVAAALLVGTLVGLVWARPHDRPQAQDITRKVTMTGGEFITARDGQDWQTTGEKVECDSGSCDFFAPVVFPCLPSVTVERIKLHVRDSNGSAQAVAVLYRARPETGADVWLGKAESPIGTGGLQPWSSDPINKVVWPSQRAYIWLSIGGPFIEVYGVTVEYHRNI
jgi:hypothetical protein